MVFASAEASPTVYNLGCHEVWHSSSSSNSLSDCLTHFAENSYPLFFPAAIPAVYGVLFLLLFPLVMLCRRIGAFGSARRRPGAGCCCDGDEWDVVPAEVKDEVYPHAHIRCIRLCVMIILVLSIAVAVTFPFGGLWARDGWIYALDGISTEVIQWVIGLRNRIYTIVEDPLTHRIPSELPADILSALDGAIEEAESVRRDMQGASDVAVPLIVTLCFVFGVAPVVLFVATFIFALYGIRRTGPCVSSVVHYVFSILFTVSGTLLLVAAMGALIVKGEVEMYDAGIPGVFSLWLVPRCEETIQFDEFKDSLRASIGSAAATGCDALLGLCDDAPTFVPGGRPFFCPSLVGDVAAEGGTAAACRSSQSLANYVADTKLKNGTGVTCGAQPPPAHDCTLAECAAAADCTAHNSSSVSLRYADLSDRLQRASEVAVADAACDALILRGMLPLARVGRIAEGFLVAGSGATFGLVLIILGSILLCKGQKVFVIRKTAEDVYGLSEGSDEEWAREKKRRRKERRRKRRMGLENGEEGGASPEAAASPGGVASEANAAVAVLPIDGGRGDAFSNPHAANNATSAGAGAGVGGAFDYAYTNDASLVLNPSGSARPPMAPAASGSWLPPQRRGGAAASGVRDEAEWSAADPSILDSTLGLGVGGPNRRVSGRAQLLAAEASGAVAPQGSAHHYPSPELMGGSQQQQQQQQGHQAAAPVRGRVAPPPPLHSVSSASPASPVARGPPPRPRGNSVSVGGVLSNNSMATMELSSPRHLDPLGDSAANNFSFSQRPQPIRGWMGSFAGRGQGTNSGSNSHADVEMMPRRPSAGAAGPHANPALLGKTGVARAAAQSSPSIAFVPRPLGEGSMNPSGGVPTNFSFVGIGTSGSPRRRQTAAANHFREFDAIHQHGGGGPASPLPPPPGSHAGKRMSLRGIGSPRLGPASYSDFGLVPSVSEFNYQHSSSFRSGAESDNPTGSPVLAGRGRGGFNQRASRSSIFFPDQGGSRGTAAPLPLPPNGSFVSVGQGGYGVDGAADVPPPGGNFSFNQNMLTTRNHSRHNLRNNAGQNLNTVGSFSFRPFQLDT